MSDESVVALAAVVVSGFVGIASLGFNFWNSYQERQQRLTERRQDNREWYKRTMFERRLAAIQGGFAWLMKFSVPLNSPEATDPSSEASQELRRMASEAREWYVNNLVFIHDGIPQASVFNGFLNKVTLYATGIPRMDPWDTYEDARRFFERRAADLMRSVEEGAPRDR